MTRLVPPERSLAVVSPVVAGQLHPTRNGALDARLLSAGSDARVWWVCAAGHEWQAPVRFRVRGTGCPYCAGRLPTAGSCLAAANPVLTAQWHPTRNAPLTPAGVLPAARARVWWQCPNGHEWRAVVSSRARGAGCPSCPRSRPARIRLAGFPDLVGQWDTAANGDLTDAVTAGSNRRVWWRCPCGHRWAACVYSRARGAGCLVCAGKLATARTNLPARFPQLMGEWAGELNGHLDPATVLPGSSRRVWWRCTTDPTHVWQARVADRTLRATGCPHCTAAQAAVKGPRPPTTAVPPTETPTPASARGPS